MSVYACAGSEARGRWWWGQGWGKEWGQSGERFQHPDCPVGGGNCLWTCWFWPGPSAVSYETAAAWRHSEMGGGHDLQALRVRQVWYYGKVKKKSCFLIYYNLFNGFEMATCYQGQNILISSHYHPSCSKIVHQMYYASRGRNTPIKRNFELNEPIYCSS